MPRKHSRTEAQKHLHVSLTVTAILAVAVGVVYWWTVQQERILTQGTDGETQRRAELLAELSGSTVEPSPQQKKILLDQLSKSEVTVTEADRQRLFDTLK